MYGRRGLWDRQMDDAGLNPRTPILSWSAVLAMVAERRCSFSGLDAARAMAGHRLWSALTSDTTCSNSARRRDRPWPLRVTATAVKEP